MKKIKVVLAIILLICLFPVSTYAAVKPTADGYYKTAAGLYNAGKYTDAIKNYDSALKLNPKYILAYVGKGNSLVKLKKYNEAVSCYDKAIKISPKDPQAFFCKGKVLFILAKYSDALKNYDTAIKLKLKSAELYFEKGKVLERLNKPEQAISAYDSAIQLNKKYTQAYLNKADILCDMEKYDEAVKSYDKVLGLNPSSLDAYTGKGYSLYYLEKYTEVISVLDKAIKLDPANAELYYMNSLSSVKSGDKQNYLAYLQKAVSLDQTYMEDARAEEIFKNLSSEDSFVQTVYDATKSIDASFDNTSILKKGALSGIKFLDIKTSGDNSEDARLKQAVSELMDNEFNGNFYNQATADACHISKDAPDRDDIIFSGRIVKSQMLVGLKTTYDLLSQDVLYIAKQSGTIKAAIVKTRYNVKFDGETTECTDWNVFVLNNGIWEFYGYLQPKTSSAGN